MSIQIIDNSASLLIKTDTDETLLMKQSIRSITIMGLTTIKIDRGKPLTGIYLLFSDISNPFARDPSALVNSVNQMITGCLCSAVGNDGG